jgi:phospholipid/cholesterol/gamma-HCH transport system permease protein
LLEVNQIDDTRVEISIGGAWTLGGEPVPWRQLVDDLENASPLPVELGFRCDELVEWDSRLLTFLLKLHAYTERKGIRFIADGLPKGVKQLLQLSLTVPERKDAKRPAQVPSLLYRLGQWTMNGFEDARVFTRFVGEWILALMRLLSGRAIFRRSDFLHFVQSAGVDALPIVSLISLLVGAVLAFVGAVQLKLFGAEVYIANLVALGMLREMGAMMTAIIMAGRTGSAYAAQLGTMQVNEEIDALKTLGISPVEFLVLPRSLALVLMLPLLCLWADALGVLGGLIVGVSLLDISLLEYLVQTRDAVSLMDLAIGLIKSVIFAGVVALAGCLRGLQSGRNSSAVGNATTSAMVTAILLIVIWDAITTLLFNRLGY